MSKKELQVSALENGTVIDHIAQGQVLQVMRILSLEEHPDHIYFGANLDSKKLGTKGIIKVSNRFFAPEEINKISLVSPSATLIEIRDYEVVSKTKVEIPDEIHDFVRCANPNCITNKQEVKTRFKVVDKKDIKLKCHYCEKTTPKQSIQFN